MDIAIPTSYVKWPAALGNWFLKAGMAMRTGHVRCGMHENKRHNMGKILSSVAKREIQCYV